MMQTANSRQRFQYRAVRFRLDGSLEWRVFIEPEMSPILVVICDELTAEPPHVRLVEGDHTIEALATCAANPVVRQNSAASDLNVNFTV
jgi:hypothetical protein